VAGGYGHQGATENVGEATSALVHSPFLVIIGLAWKTSGLG
jgi:hypothetical protein